MTAGKKLLLALLLLAPKAQAQEVTLTVTPANDTLQAVLENAATTIDLTQDKEAVAQDYLATAQADYRRLLTGLYTEGFYGGQVSIRIDGREAASIPPLDAPAVISRIAITVIPGPEFTFGTAQIGPLAPATELPSGYAEGQTARSTDIEAATRAASGAWRDAGHAKVGVAGQKIVANHPNRTLEASVALDPGPLLRFGPLSVKGNRAVRTQRIVEIAGLPVGETYSPEQIKLATARLRRTGTFRTVAMDEAENWTPDYRLPMNVTVEERKPRRIGAGLEYSNVDGVTLSAFWLHRNIFGGAERFRVEGEVANITEEGDGTDYKLKFEFDRPGTIGPENDFYARLGFEELNEPEYYLREVSAEVGFNRIVDEEFTISAGIGLLAGETKDDLGDRDYLLLTLPVKSTLDKRDDSKDAKRGYYMAAEVTPFKNLNGGAFGGRLTFDGRLYRSLLDDDRLTFAGRVQLGSVLGASAAETPANFLFFSGGGGSVRGQPYQSLGVVRDDGTEVGGLSYLATSVEARYSIRPKIGLVGFYDWGRVSNERIPGQGGNHHAGAGIGARYKTPLGPIRLDLATPVTGDDAYEELQVYLGIGQAF